MAKYSLIPAVSVPTEGTFNKHPVITFPNPDNPAEPGVQMGVKKVKAVIRNIEAAKAFVEKHDKPKGDKRVDKLASLLKSLGVKDEELKAALESV